MLIRGGDATIDQGRGGTATQAEVHLGRGDNQVTCTYYGSAYYGSTYYGATYYGATYYGATYYVTSEYSHIPHARATAAAPSPVEA